MSLLGEKNVCEKKKFIWIESIESNNFLSLPHLTGSMQTCV